MHYCATGRLFFLDDTQGTLLNALYSSTDTPPHHPQGEYANEYANANNKKKEFIQGSSRNKWLFSSQSVAESTLFAECDREVLLRRL